MNSKTAIKRTLLAGLALGIYNMNNIYSWFTGLNKNGEMVS